MNIMNPDSYERINTVFGLRRWMALMLLDKGFLPPSSSSDKTMELSSVCVFSM